MAGAEGPAEGGGGVTASKLNAHFQKTLESLGLPVVPGTAVGGEERVMTYNYTLLPLQHADNRPLFLKALAQVHLFLPRRENSVMLRSRIISALLLGGFSFPEVIDATDETGQHYVYETSIVLSLEDLQNET